MLVYVTGLSWSVSAQDDRLDRLFTIKRVEVDQVARSSAEAQARALEQAERTALTKLLAKLTLVEDRAALPALNRAEIERLLSGFEVEDEQFSSRRYRAAITFRFEPDLVSRFLADNGVPHVLAAGGGLIPFHIHSRGLTQFLWEDDAVVAAARDSVDWGNRLRQYDFPADGLEMRLKVSPSLVQSEGVASIARLIEKPADTAVMLVRTHWFAPGDALTYSVRLEGSDWSISGSVEASDYAPEMGQRDDIDIGSDEERAIATALARIADAVDRDWKSRLLVDVSQVGDLPIEVPTVSLRDWVTVRRRLEQLSLVRSLKIDQIAIPLSSATVAYTGRLDQLDLAMREIGLHVEKTETLWRVSLNATEN